MTGLAATTTIPRASRAPASKIDQYGLPHFADEYVWPDAVMNKSRGWEIYPKGLYDFGMDCAKNYPDLEWFVSENGIGIMDESTRIVTPREPFRTTIASTLCASTLSGSPRPLTKGPSAAATTTGPSLTTGPSANAFKNRYGFVEVDLMDGYQRRLKKSAAWLKQVATTHVVD